VYDVVDDEPLTRAALAAVLGEVVGRRVRRLPTRLVRAALGPRMAFLLRSQRVSHRRFTAATGWTPQVRSAAGGLSTLTRAAVPVPVPGRRGTGW
jgi:NAD dependent epimerase/dehydratase family enzyme